MTPSQDRSAGTPAAVRTDVRRPRHPRRRGGPRAGWWRCPAGPVLAPLENADRLAQIALPGGAVTANTMGRHQHDAAAAGSLIFVGNE